MDKFGFIYLWFNKVRKMYYIGSHWGTEDDGYICSNNWMRNDYNRHQENFKRRIVSRIYTNRIDTFLEEERWLSKIKDTELSIRYYNLTKSIKDHWSQYPEKVKKLSEKISISQKKRTSNPLVKEKMRNRRHSDESKEKIRQTKLGKTSNRKGVIHSDESKEKMRQAKLGKKQSPETIEKRMIKIRGQKKNDTTMYQKENNSFFGRKHSDESKEKMRITLKGRPAWNKGMKFVDGKWIKYN